MSFTYSVLYSIDVLYPPVLFSDRRPLPVYTACALFDRRPLPTRALVDRRPLPILHALFDPFCAWQACMYCGTYIV